MKKLFLLITIICYNTISNAQSYGTNWVETIDWLNIQLDKKESVKVNIGSGWENHDYGFDIDYNGRILIKFMDDDFNTYRLTANIKDLKSYYKDDNILELQFSSQVVKAEVLHFTTIKEIDYFDGIEFNIYKKGLSVQLAEGFNQLITLTKKGEIEKSNRSHHNSMQVATKKMLAQHEQLTEIKSSNLELIYKYKGSEIAKAAFIKGYKNIFNNRDDIESSTKLFVEAIIHDPYLIFLRTMVKNGELDEIGNTKNSTASEKLNLILTICALRQDNQRVFYKLFLLQINGDKDNYSYFDDVLSEMRITTGYVDERIFLAKVLLMKTSRKAFRGHANTEIYKYRAFAYRILSDPESGLKEVNKAFKSNLREECLRNRASYYSWYKKYQKAIDDLVEAREIYLKNGNERKVKSIDRVIELYERFKK
ncbi:MAG: hypothetical protein HRT87_11530 [Legionellales bacterium]|nr:hypothetical protein [Legionellales bacterium]